MKISHFSGSIFGIICSISILSWVSNKMSCLVDFYSEHLTFSLATIIIYTNAIHAHINAKLGIYHIYELKNLCMLNYRMNHKN